MVDRVMPRLLIRTYQLSIRPALPVIRSAVAQSPGLLEVVADGSDHDLSRGIRVRVEAFDEGDAAATVARLVCRAIRRSEHWCDAPDREVLQAFRLLSFSDLVEVDARHFEPEPGDTTYRVAGFDHRGDVLVEIGSPWDPRRERGHVYVTQADLDDAGMLLPGAVSGTGQIVSYFHGSAPGVGSPETDPKEGYDDRQRREIAEAARFRRRYR